MAARSAFQVTVTTSGLFFANPVGQLHMNIYDVLDEAANVGVDTARSQLQPDHGYLTGNLHDSIQPRFVNATRGVAWTGRAKVISGARGFETVRYYAGRMERKYHFIREANKAVKAWMESGQVQETLHRRLS